MKPCSLRIKVHLRADRIPMSSWSTLIRSWTAVRHARTRSRTTPRDDSRGVNSRPAVLAGLSWNSVTASLKLEVDADFWSCPRESKLEVEADLVRSFLVGVSRASCATGASMPLLFCFDAQNAARNQSQSLRYQHLFGKNGITITKCRASRQKCNTDNLTTHCKY